MQVTLKSQAVFTGTGLHRGRPVRMIVAPAPAGHGITFARSDMPGTAPIPARWDAVVPSQLCTLMRGEDGAEVSTVEHIMAALAGCGVTNARVSVSGPEVPIMDGSSAPFVRGFLKAGLIQQDAPARAIRLVRPVEVRNGEATARLDPADEFAMAFDITFEDAAIGTQTRSMSLANGAFVRELCDSRTFCRARDVEMMHEKGLALGGTYENAVVVEGEKVLSPGGLRHADEAVRHKMLDALGDLALAGAPLLARYTGHRAGHALTNKLLHALFADPDAFEVIDLTPAQAARLPGTGLSRADLAEVA